DDVRRCLKPGGVFVAYNYYREGWIVARLERTLADVFGREPLVFTLPPRDAIRPDDPFWAFTLLVAGDTEPLRRAAEARRPLLPWTVGRPHSPLRVPTDDWPFLSLRRPGIPRLTLRAIALMAAAAALVLAWSARTTERRRADLPLLAAFFFLGAGFML